MPFLFPIFSWRQYMPFSPHKDTEHTETWLQSLKKIHIHNRRTTFILKMTVGCVIAMFIGQLLGLQKGMWICMTVMSLTQPQQDTTNYRIKWRIIGTLIGFGAYLLLFGGLFPKSSAFIITLVLAYVYTFIKDYHIQMIFITVNSLNAASTLFSIPTAMMMRLSFILTGAVLAGLLAKLEYGYLQKETYS